MSDNQKNGGNDNAGKDNQSEKLATAADFEQTVREAEQEKKTLEPGQSQGSNSNQNNNGRGGGK